MPRTRHIWSVGRPCRYLSTTRRRYLPGRVPTALRTRPRVSPSPGFCCEFGGEDTENLREAFEKNLIRSVRRHRQVRHLFMVMVKSQVLRLHSQRNFLRPSRAARKTSWVTSSTSPGQPSRRLASTATSAECRRMIVSKAVSSPRLNRSTRSRSSTISAMTNILDPARRRTLQKTRSGSVTFCTSAQYHFGSCRRIRHLETAICWVENAAFTFLFWPCLS
jgi:hypothetical protein